MNLAPRINPALTSIVHYARLRGMDAREIIGRWPSQTVLAGDVGRSRNTIYSWANRNRIPGDLDVDLVAAAKSRGIDLTFEDLARARAGLCES